jgi:hypothetical protein
MKLKDKTHKNWSLALTMGICTGVWTTLVYIVLRDIILWW